ncbi:MAG TPA: PA0069 family radical SAM protein, partial [Gammaproteobacteria bacterium]|nr:PA0069 family radical SAM protein [Gammaproteobacteria bacterium]
MQNKTIKNRGSFSNPEGRFESEKKESFDDGWNIYEEEPLPTLETTLLIERAKSIITKNDSPDISFDQSINPYRGCEHGCIYCYARPSHAYMNLSPGLDFESKIFYKNNAAELLKNEITKPKYICKTIVIGANTDPYQPAEGQLKITRSLLEVALQYSHPIAIITKGSLILRDLDLLTMLAEKNLVRVAVTVTTLDTQLKRILEPRASAPSARLRVIKELSSKGIPITVMAAPMIPMINDMELEHILETASTNGAQHAGYTFIRLPYEVKDLFKEWLGKHFPDRAEHVMSIIRQMRGGKEYDSSFGQR